jgi:hypothetical protein
VAWAAFDGFLSLAIATVVARVLLEAGLGTTRALGRPFSLAFIMSVFSGFAAPTLIVGVATPAKGPSWLSRALDRVLEISRRFLDIEGKPFQSISVIVVVCLACVYVIGFCAYLLLHLI